jgi:hypothetical protein
VPKNPNPERYVSDYNTLIELVNP